MLREDFVMYVRLLGQSSNTLLEEMWYGHKWLSQYVKVEFKCELGSSKFG